MNTKVKEGGGGDAPGRAEIPFQPVEKTMVEMVFSCSQVHTGADIHSADHEELHAVAVAHFLEELWLMKNPS